MLFLLSCSLGAAENSAEQKPVVPAGIPVTSIVQDEDAATPPNQLLFRSDDFNASGYATYTNVDNVISTVGNPGGWTLRLYNQTLRTVRLQFMPVGSTPVPTDGYYSAKVEIYSHCYDPSNHEIAFLTILPGTSANHCDFAFDFATTSTKYKMAMGQTLSPAGGPDGLAMVACNAGNGSTCVNWTITPNTSAANPTIANLYSYARNGSLQYLGQCYLTFRIDVTNP